MRKPDEPQAPRRAHELKLSERNRLELTGVSDVDSFCDQLIVMNTSQGELTVTGRELHISNLNLGDGSLNIDGLILALEYSDARPASRRGLWRVFR